MRARETKSTLKNKKRSYPDALDKGKGRADDIILPVSQDPPRIKKPKRAETRPCPICNEPIPLRLMSLHAQLESERVEGIIKQIGSLEPILYPEELDDGPSSSTAPRSRRSALKALKSFSRFPSDVYNFPSTFYATLDQVTKIIQSIQRNRKNRYARYREMWREEEAGYSLRIGGTRRARVGSGEVEYECPVCLQTVWGDDDVVNAHVDACLAGGNWNREERRARAGEEGRAREYIDLPDGAVGHVGDVRGLGFHTRNPNAQDVEDEIDIDGDDQEIYGEPQFTEQDILPLRSASPGIDMDEYVEVEIDEVDAEEAARPETLRQLIGGAEAQAEKRGPHVEESTPASTLQRSSVEELDVAIINAKEKKYKNALIAALESKIEYLESSRNSSPSSSLCRICLDPYNEPTISTGCWHTCCKECWLRTLGSTKLCPICKRITGATELRRIYL